MTQNDFLKEIVKKALKDTLPENLTPQQQSKKKSLFLNEASVIVPKSFNLKTELISGLVKELHTKLYQEAIKAYNSVSSLLDSVNREDSQNSGNSQFRRLKIDETSNLNSIKLHELMFSNISDLHSEIRVDSLPYIRFARDWGTFENWQIDFRACGLASKEGWVICVFDPYKQKYSNIIVEDDECGIPVGTIPVLVMDTHHHAWWRDFPGDKLGYLNGMMKELNWSVVEARMAVAEKNSLSTLYGIQAADTVSNEKLVTVLPQEPPIAKDQIVHDNNALIVKMV